MPLLQLFLSLAFLTAFFIGLFLVAWYIALPLLLVWAGLSVFYTLRARLFEHRMQKAANGCSLKPHTDKPTSSPIIDVDYTELDS